MEQSWEYINRSQTHEYGIGTEAAQFREKEYINGIFVAVHERTAQHTFKGLYQNKRITPWEDGTERDKQEKINS